MRAANATLYLDQGYHELDLLSRHLVENGDTEIREEAVNFVESQIVLPLSTSAGETDAFAFAMNFFDVDGDGAKELFITVLETSQCGDGCRTMVYRRAGENWDLVAEGMSAKLLVKKDSIAFVRIDAPNRVWDFDASAAAFRERPSDKVSKEPAIEFNMTQPQ